MVKKFKVKLTGQILDWFDNGWSEKFMDGPPNGVWLDTDGLNLKFYKFDEVELVEDV